MPSTSAADFTDIAGRLVLDRDAGGHRHYLDGRPVPLGSLLELQVVRWASDDEGEWLEPVPDEWVVVRYEATFADRTEDVRVHILGTVAGRTARIEFSPGMRFRWPAR